MTNGDKIFVEYYRTNFWENPESVSGAGSTLAATRAIRRQLPGLLKAYEINTLLDIPCGDFNWFHKLWLDSLSSWLHGYIGADIVPELIEENQQKYYDLLGVEFEVLDVRGDALPAVDLVLCRDLLGHLSNADVQAALANIRRSEAKYLLATTFPSWENSGDIKTGQWRPLNLARLWGLGSPIEVISEGCEIPGVEDKALGLWQLR